jgi:haloalkane dehalogenase
MMHYVDEGPAHSAHARETLLFVHGNPTWSFHWRNLILSFRDSFRCLAVDHLGCGLSDKGGPPLRLSDRIAHLVELVERLELSEITLVAQDWGGAIGLGALLQRRDRFRRIALFNTGAFPPWFIPWRIRACRLPILGRMAVQGAGLFSRAALRMTLARHRSLDPVVRAAYLAPYSDWGNRQAIYDFVMDIPDTPRHPTWHTLREIESGLASLSDLPSLLCWGTRDWCFTPECLDRFTAVWPSALVRPVHDAGHWVVEDAPLEARDALAGLMGVADARHSLQESSRAAIHNATPFSS